MIFFPLEAENEEDRTIACISSLTLGILSLGLCHLTCAIFRGCSWITPDVIEEVDRRIQNVANQTPLRSPKDDPINYLIPYILNHDLSDVPQKILGMLCTLCESRLPQDSNGWPSQGFPSLGNDLVEVSYEMMTAPIMTGVGPGGRPFFALKLQSQPPEQHVEQLHSSGGVMKTYQRAVVIGQQHLPGDLWYSGDGRNLWMQLSPNKDDCPAFFNGNLTCPLSASFMESQRSGFQLLQKLIEDGQGKDLHGIKWQLVT